MLYFFFARTYILSGELVVVDVQCHPARRTQMSMYSEYLPSVPVPAIFSKSPGGPIGFDTAGVFYLQRRPSLRLNETAFLMSTVKWALNCTDKALIYLLSTGRRRILENIKDKVSEIEAIVAECVYMNDLDAEAIQAKILVSIEAQLSDLQEETLELGRLRQACDDGVNAVVGRHIFLKHILPCAYHVFKTDLYEAWLKEVELYSRAIL